MLAYYCWSQHEGAAGFTEAGWVGAGRAECHVSDFFRETNYFLIKKKYSSWKQL